MYESKRLMLQMLDNVLMCLSLICYLSLICIYKLYILLRGTGKEYRLENEAWGVD